MPSPRAFPLIPFPFTIQIQIEIPIPQSYDVFLYIYVSLAKDLFIHPTNITETAELLISPFRLLRLILWDK